MSTKDITIADLVRQIDECHERIGTLERERDRLTRDLVAAQAQLDTANAKVFHHERRGW